jgi:hypothetical protein
VLVKREPQLEIERVYEPDEEAIARAIAILLRDEDEPDSRSII